MTIEMGHDVINKAVHMILLGSAPSVIMGLLVGLIISIFQAVTQIQEQTLTFVPKMVVVLLVFAATFPWLFQSLVEMTLSLWQNIPLYAR